MELNSGDSFEQYFRWANVGQIKRVVGQLREAGFMKATEITEQAIGIAFPNGIPLTEGEKDDLAHNWTDEQEMHLSELAAQFQDFNGTITNSLADRIRRYGPPTQYLNETD